MVNTPEEFTEELKKIYVDNLKSVILYGSAASGEYLKKISDFNLLVILERASLSELKKISPLVKKWIKLGNPPPLMFTLERFRSSSDVFPIEFLDIRDCRKILYGFDPFPDLTIETQNLRLELEHELKGKLIQIRERYLTTEGKPKQVKELLIKSFSTFLVLFRNVLRLYGEEPPLKKLVALEKLAAKIPFDLEVFQKIEELRKGNKSIPDIEIETIMERYLKAIETITDTVDKL